MNEIQSRELMQGECIDDRPGDIGNPLEGVCESSRPHFDRSQAFEHQVCHGDVNEGFRGHG